MTPPAAGERIRVLLADDDPHIRDAIGEIIADDVTLELVATATDAREAIALVARHKPDVALIDVRMPAGGGRQAARRMRDVSPGTAVVALSAASDRDSVVSMVEAGAVGYLVKGIPEQELIDGIHLAALHESALSTEVAGHVVGELSRKLGIERATEAVQERRAARIRRAVAGTGLDMVFQPIVHLRTGRRVGHEALARFAGTPPRPPDAWFREAADTGQLVALELRAVRAALAAVAEHRPDGLVTLNVSPETVATAALADVLQEPPWGRPDTVVLEITEHAPIADYAAAARSIDRLRALGVRLAVDDAGAGFASLAHVLKLAPDFIKLDMSITAQVDRDRAVRALTSALVGFARETDATIIAEGIETPRQLETLADIGVPCGQGFHLGRPGPLDA
ncbi:MAG: EAL domain-containing protein, partial [Actinomycetota bacterium]